MKDGNELELTERELNEISLALVYEELYNHGTSGHMAYVVIAKLARHIERLYGAGIRAIAVLPPSTTDAGDERKRTLACNCGSK